MQFILENKQKKKHILHSKQDKPFRTFGLVIFRHFYQAREKIIHIFATSVKPLNSETPPNSQHIINLQNKL